MIQTERRNIMKDIRVLDPASSPTDAYNSLPGNSESFEEAVATLKAVKSVTKDKDLTLATKKEEPA